MPVLTCGKVVAYKHLEHTSLCPKKKGHRGACYGGGERTTKNPNATLDNRNADVYSAHGSAEGLHGAERAREQTPTPNSGHGVKDDDLGE